MNSYTLTLVLKPDLEEKVRKELLESVAKKVDKITKQDEWGLRDLAYPIKHQRKGFYTHLEFEAEAAALLKLDKFLKLEEDIIRYLLVRI